MIEFSNIEIITTTPDQITADRMAQALLEERLAACIQVSGPVSSHYRWEGLNRHDQEWICTIKTNCDLFTTVSRRIQELHPYDNPQIIALPIIMLSEKYQQWLESGISVK